MQIKSPVGYDFSYYVEIPDMALLNPRPLFVYTKATEGETITDPKFERYWQDLKEDSISRGAFHFFRKALSSTKQADKFLAVVKAQGVDNNDKIILDIEEEGVSAAQIIAWIERVELTLGNQIMIYSRANILNAIAATAAQIQKLKQYPIITAGYPDTPDNFTNVPAVYIPDQTRWGPVAGWQYAELTAEAAGVSGVTGKVDFNWLAPWFIETLTPPVPDIETDPVSQAIRYLADEISAAIKTIKIPGSDGTTPPPQLPARTSAWSLKNKGTGTNHVYKCYKTPNTEDTNFEYITDNNIVILINKWQDVPGGLVAWNKESDIGKQNIYQNWACLEMTTAVNINGKLRTFPSIKYGDGSTASHVWLERQNLDRQK